MIKPKKSVQKMKAYNPPLEGRRNMLRLDFNENTLGPSRKVICAIRKVNPDWICSYPEYASFKGKLADYTRVKPEQLAITNATDETIKLIMDTYVSIGDEVLIPVPTFPMFRFYAELEGANIVEVPLNTDLSFPTEKVIGKISKKTKVVVLVNPNSPTGTEIPRKDIIRVLEKAKNSIVVLDEAYFQFFGKSYKDLISKYDNLIVIQTFSKAFGLGGLRLGYAISDKKNIANLSKANSPYSVNSLAVAAGSAALDDTRFVQKYVSEIARSREYFLSCLDNFGIKYYPTSANFVLIDFGKRNSEVVIGLRDRGILVRDQSDKSLLKNCTRITIGTLRQMKFLVSKLREIL